MAMMTAAFDLVKKLGEFAPGLSGGDPTWNILFPDQKGRWHQLHVSEYRSSFYVSDATGTEGALRVEPNKTAEIVDVLGVSRPSLEYDDHLAASWESVLLAAHRWLEVVSRDWIRANRRVQTEYPLSFRYGIVPHALVRASLPDIRRVDRELGKGRTRKMVRLVESGSLTRHEAGVTPSMTVSRYLDYCRIAYIAGKRRGESVDESLDGRALYEQYADGRHDGLLDIAPDSEQEFADWLDGTHPRRNRGGHPWEIKRGGNTTHIDLAVHRPLSGAGTGFRVVLQGESSGRLAETVRMLLAIHQADLPLAIANPENVRKRLLAQDNIGIVPSHSSLHRADQHFVEADEVFDVLHYDDLGRYRRKLTPFITWKPLPVLRPVDV